MASPFRMVWDHLDGCDRTMVVYWSRRSKGSLVPVFFVTRLIGRIYHPLFVLQTEQYVEPAPDMIAG